MNSDFIDSLFSYEYFGLYLMIAIVVLLILFILILLLGKKDQKNREIEATKKLLKVEDSNEAVKIDNNEVPLEVSEKNLESDTIVLPTIDNILPKEEPKLEVKNEELELPNLDGLENVTLNEQTNNNIEMHNKKSEENEEKMFFSSEKRVEEPILNNDEDQPFTFVSDEFFKENAPTNEESSPVLDFKMEVPNLKEAEKELNKELDIELPKIEDEPVISVPEFNYDEVISDAKETENREEKKNYNIGQNVFSSVYAPKREDMTSDMEVPNIDIPKVLEDAKKISNIDDEIELPSLKQNPVKENESKIALNDYNLDDLTGEIYTINNK